MVICESDSDNGLINNYYYALTTEHASNPPPLPISDTGIADSGASGFFFAPDAPASNQNHHAPTIGVQLANRVSERSIASATLASIPLLPLAAMQGHVMPSFTSSLIGLGPFVDMGCTVTFTATGVSVIHPDGHSLLEGWREQSGARFWRFPLQPNNQPEM